MIIILVTFCSSWRTHPNVQVDARCPPFGNQFTTNRSARSKPPEPVPPLHYSATISVLLRILIFTFLNFSSSLPSALLPTPDSLPLRTSSFHHDSCCRSLHPLYSSVYHCLHLFLSVSYQVLSNRIVAIKMSDTWSWTASIGYEQFVRDSCTYFSHSFSLLTTGYKFPGQFWTDASAVARNNRDPYMFLYLALFTIGWTMLRNAFTDYIVKVRCFVRKYFYIIYAGSTWNSLQSFCICLAHWQTMWTSGRSARKAAGMCLEMVLLHLFVVDGRLHLIDQRKRTSAVTSFFNLARFVGRSKLIRLTIVLTRISFHFGLYATDWNFTRPLPFHYHLLYVGQLSFYLHSMHATLFMDRWRKDSIVLLYHHVVAVALIFFTFSARAHQAATITFFLHDICDIWLEGTKCLLYFKDQGKKTYVIFEYAANVGFIVFSVTWFAARLYAFPLRLVWICSTHLHTVGLVVPLMFMLNSLLYILLAMNVYWFTVTHYFFQLDLILQFFL